ncbi:MAG: acyltransferase family protein [Acidimicrobiales bacterium]
MHHQSTRQAPSHAGRAGWTGQSLARAFDPRSNSLGFLRFAFAVGVLVDHSFDLGGFHNHLDPMWQWTLGQESIAGFAVGGFFVISGFLITRSFMSSRSAGNFMWRRFLRIFPGFWVCLVVTAFVFAPLVWWHVHGSTAGFTHAQPGPLGYVFHNFWLWMNQYGIAGLLATTPNYVFGHSLAFNGSLWTLIYEFKCYLGVAVLGLFGVLRKGRVVVLGLAVFLWGIQLVNTMVPGSAVRLAPLLGDVQLVRLTLFFAIGSAMCLYSEKIVISNTFAAFAAAALVFSLRNQLYTAIGEVAFAYLVMWLATALPLARFDSRGDFSYGIYIYAFPVEQMLSAWKFNRQGFVPYIAVSLAITLVLAVASWFAIERPCLTLKNMTLKRLRPTGWIPTGLRPADISPTPDRIDGVGRPRSGPGSRSRRELRWAGAGFRALRPGTARRRSMGAGAGPVDEPRA